MRTILIGPDQTINNDLAAAIAAFSEIELTRQVAEYPDPDELVRIVRSRRPDFLFRSVDGFDRFKVLAGALGGQLPGLAVIGVAREVKPLELILNMMHLGIRELLTAPVTKEKLGPAIASVAQIVSTHPAPVVRLADLYAFLPAKPGVGSSTITVSTSCALAEELGVRTLLLDCDLMAGVTKFLLKLGNSSFIVNAMIQADSLDEDRWCQMIGKWANWRYCTPASLLLNRKNPAHTGFTDHDVAPLAGLPVALQFSNDYPGVQGAILDGVPVSHRSSLGHSILHLARSLAPDAAGHQGPPPEHRKFLEFLHVPSARDQETVWRG